MIDRIVGMQRVFALPVAERYAVAGRIAALPAEHARLAERLASALATSLTEAGALNALYVLELCKELVPAFKAHVSDERLSRAAELCPHERAKAAVLRGELPAEWESAKAAAPAPQLVLLPQDEDDDVDVSVNMGFIAGAADTVSDATRFVGGAALGGVGLMTDVLGLTTGAEVALASTAEDAVDVVGDGVHRVAVAVDDGIGDTVDDVTRKGVVGAVGDGVADAVDIVSDFVGDGVHCIAEGVGSLLDWATGREEQPSAGMHRLMVQVAELFGEERSLGLRLENRVVTKFTKPEAESLGFRLGDAIMAVGARVVNTQEELLEAIVEAKDALKNNGSPVRFVVERLGPLPSAAR